MIKINGAGYKFAELSVHVKPQLALSEVVKPSRLQANNSFQHASCFIIGCPIAYQLGRQAATSML